MADPEVRPRRSQFYIDLVYGLVFIAGFAYLALVEMDARVAAFEGGIVIGYFLRVWEKMTLYEQALASMVSEEAQRQVATEVEEKVAPEVEDRVAEQVDAAEERLEDDLEEQVATEVADRIADEVEEKIGPEVEDRLSEELDEIEERLERERRTDGGSEEA